MTITPTSSTRPADLTLKTLWAELDDMSGRLSRALSLVELCRTVSTRKGRVAAEYAGLAESSVAEALWIAEESIRESSARIMALLGAIERERNQGGGP